MVVDKFTKFILSVIAIFLCLNTLNPWLSPALVSAQVGSTSLQQDILDIEVADEEEIARKNAILFHRLADLIKKKTTYEIQKLENAVFDEDTETDLAVIQIATTLAQLAHIESQRLKLQIEHNFFQCRNL